MKSDMKTGGGILTIASRRLGMKGGQLMVTMSSKTSATDAVKITQLGATDLELGMLGTGTVTVPDTLAAKGFKPGKASLLIGKNPAEPIRFYLAPVVQTPGDVIPIAAASEIPLWVGIGDGKKLVMLSDTQTGSQPLHFLEYAIDNITVPVEAGKYPKKIIRATMTSANKFTAHVDGNAIPADTVLLRKNPVGMSTYSAEIQTSYKMPTNISVSRTGDILGVIADGKVDAYFIESAFDATTPVVNVGGISSPALIAAGDINEDGKSDLIVWNGATLVAMKQAVNNTGPSFSVDEDIGNQLNAALNGDKPVQIIIQDMDADGWEDVVYSTSGKINWLSNLGPGPDGKYKFSKQTGIAIASGFDSFATGDLNGDRKIDLAIAVGSTVPKKLNYFINSATY